MDTNPLSAREKLVKVLCAMRKYLALEGNDFSWSSWDSQELALAEMDNFIGALQNGYKVDVSVLAMLFAPTGPIQETSLSSGWGQNFVEMASEFDSVLAEYTNTDFHN